MLLGPDCSLGLLQRVLLLLVIRRVGFPPAKLFDLLFRQNADFFIAAGSRPFLSTANDNLVRFDWLRSELNASRKLEQRTNDAPRDRIEQHEKRQRNKRTGFELLEDVDGRMLIVRHVC